MSECTIFTFVWLFPVCVLKCMMRWSEEKKEIVGKRDGLIGKEAGRGDVLGGGAAMQTRVTDKGEGGGGKTRGKKRRKAIES